MKLISSIFLLWMIFLSGIVYGAPFPNQFVKDFQCYEALKGNFLTEKAGGPKGSNWNPTDIICEADFTDLSNDSSIDYLEVQLSFGQGKVLKLVGKIFLKQYSSFNLDPLARLTRVISITKRVFLIPHLVFMTELKHETKPFGIYWVNFTMQVSGYRNNGEKIGPEKREIKAKFAFGE